jgi:hypothetical protein
VGTLEPLGSDGALLRGQHALGVNLLLVSGVQALADLAIAERGSSRDQRVRAAILARSAGDIGTADLLGLLWCHPQSGCDAAWPYRG